MHTLAIGMPGAWEWVIILIIGLLLFGRRLPEVGRSLGKGIVEFEKGIRGIEDEINQNATVPPAQPASREPAPARPALRQPERWEGEDVRVSQSAPQPPPKVS